MLHMTLINVRCHRWEAEALTRAVKAARAVELEWLREHRKAIGERAAADELPVAQRRALLDELDDEFARRRGTGEFAGTRALYVRPALRQVLDEHGWTGRRFKPVPRKRAGRPWGAHDRGFTARVGLYLPDDLAELITRGCYWTSRLAVERLQQWYDVHGDHWRGQLHDPNARWTGVGPSHADLRARDELIGQVLTTGDVLRKVLRAALPDGG
jgi:hypothetical protein